MAQAKVKQEEMKTRNKTNPYNIEDVDFVFHNYADMSATEIAKERNLATFQVTQIVNGLRTAGAPLPKKTRKSLIAEYVENLPKTKGRKRS